MLDYPGGIIITRVLTEGTQEESDGRCRDESSERMQRRSEDARPDREAAAAHEARVAAGPQRSGNQILL